MEIREGDVLAGKYRVERVLGRGGMGMVVAARHIALDEQVAMKFLLPEMLGEQEAVGRFLREARAAARIKNEHVARVSDVGELENGAPYLVMEYLEGKDLSALLQERGPFPVEEAVDYVVQTCEGIAGAHALGIVHRDLKPANLMRVTRGDGLPFIKVLDFGISKIATSDASMAMTRTAAILGSPFYMSPEQMTSARDVDGRADIWSLGTVLYELLTGSPPFTSESLPGLALFITTKPHPPMREQRPDLPAELDAIVSRCLAKQREDRFSNVAELARALAAFAPEHAHPSIRSSARILGAPDPNGNAPPLSLHGGSGPHSTSPVVHSSPDVRIPETTGTTSDIGHGSSRKSRSGLALAVLAVAGIATVGVAFVRSDKQRAETVVMPSSATAPTAAASVTTTEPPPALDSARVEPAERLAATAGKPDEPTLTVVAPAPPAAKPASAPKHSPARQRPAGPKAAAKQPESAYEHM